MATVGEGNGVCLWDVATGEMTLQSVEVAVVTTAQFSGDGQRLIAGGPDGVSPLIWDLACASARPSSLPGAGPVWHGSMVATFATNHFWVADIQSGKILLESPLERPPGAGQEHTPTGTFSTDGRRLLVEIWTTARLWDLPSGKELPQPAETQNLELSADGPKTLTVNKSLKIWDAESGRLLREIKPAEGEEFISAQFSCDARLVATDSKSGEGARSVQLWDAATGQAVSPPLAGRELPRTSFSADGTRLIAFSTGEENSVLLSVWNVSNQEAVDEPAKIRKVGMEDWPSPIFSSDGRRFLVLLERAMRLFETASGKLIDSPPIRRGTFGRARFSADGKFFATTGDGVQVWNATTGLPMTDPIKAPATFQYDSVEFSADGRRLLAAGIGGPEGTWGNTGILDVATGRPIADSRKAEGPWQAAHFSPDDCLVVEASNPVRVWNVAPPGKGPMWIADLAEAVSGCVLTNAGALEVIPDRAKRLAAIRKQVAELPAEDRWAQIARWFLAEPRTRTISPYSFVKVTDYVERRAKENTFEKLKEAVAASPADAVVHALLGVKLVELGEMEREALVRADGETLLATQLAPQNAAVWQSRAKVLTALKRPAEAAAATKTAQDLARP